MPKFLTQKELELAFEDVVREFENDHQIDAVYVPPNIDELTDEEDFSEDTNRAEENKNAGTFHTSENDLYNSPDEKSLAVKRQKILKNSINLNPVWHSGQFLHQNLPKSNEEERIYPQFILWAYIVLPTICLLLSPSLIRSIVRAQQQTAKIMAQGINARAKAAAALARNNGKIYQRKFGQNSKFSSMMEPKFFKLRTKRQNTDLLRKATHWDQQDESIGQLENMWNMNNFGNMQNDDVLRNVQMDEFRNIHSNVEMIGSPRIYDEKSPGESNIYKGIFFSRNVFDDVVAKSSPVPNEHNENNMMAPSEKSANPSPTRKKKNEGINYYYPNHYYNSYNTYPFHRSNSESAQPQQIEITVPIVGENHNYEYVESSPFSTHNTQQSPNSEFFEESMKSANPEPTHNTKKNKKKNDNYSYYPQNYYHSYYPGSFYGRSNENIDQSKNMENTEVQGYLTRENSFEFMEEKSADPTHHHHKKSKKKHEHGSGYDFGSSSYRRSSSDLENIDASKQDTLKEVISLQPNPLIEEDSETRSAHRSLDHNHEHDDLVGCELDENMFGNMHSSDGHFDPTSYYQRTVEEISKFNEKIALEAKKLMPTTPASPHFKTDTPYSEPNHSDNSDTALETDESGIQRPELHSNEHDNDSPYDRDESELRSAHEHSGDSSWNVKSASPHLHSHGYTHSHTHVHTHGKTFGTNKGTHSIHGGSEISPVFLPSHRITSKAEAHASAHNFNYGNTLNQFSHYNSLTGGIGQSGSNGYAQANAASLIPQSHSVGFGHAGAQAQSGITTLAGNQQFSGGGFTQTAPQGQTFSGTGVSQASSQGHAQGQAGTIALAGNQHFPGGGFSQIAPQSHGFNQASAQGYSNAQGFNGGSFGQAAAQAHSHSASQTFSTGFSQSSAQASAQTSQGGSQLFQVGAPRYSVPSQDSDSILGQPKGDRSFVMPHMQEIPVDGLIHNMEDTLNTFPRSRNIRQNVFDGLNLASSIVDSSLNIYPSNFHNGEPKPRDNMDLNRKNMKFITDMVDSSLKVNKLMNSNDNSIQLESKDGKFVDKNECTASSNFDNDKLMKDNLKQSPESGVFDEILRKKRKSSMNTLTYKHAGLDFETSDEEPHISKNESDPETGMNENIMIHTLMHGNGDSLYQSKNNNHMLDAITVDEPNSQKLTEHSTTQNGISTPSTKKYEESIVEMIDPTEILTTEHMTIEPWASNWDYKNNREYFPHEIAPVNIADNSKFKSDLDKSKSVQVAFQTIKQNETLPQNFGNDTAEFESSELHNKNNRLSHILATKTNDDGTNRFKSYLQTHNNQHGFNENISNSSISINSTVDERNNSSSGDISQLNKLTKDKHEEKNNSSEEINSNESNKENSKKDEVILGSIAAMISSESKKNNTELTGEEIEDIQFRIPNNVIGNNETANKTNKIADTENINNESIGNMASQIKTPIYSSNNEKISNIFKNASNNTFDSIEAEMGALTAEEKEAFIKQEMELISAVIEEALRNNRIGENRTEIKNTSKSEDKEHSSESKVVSSPNLFQSYGREDNHEEYRRNSRATNEAFDVIVGAHKEKLEDIQKEATDDDDLLMISFIGDSVIKDLENRRKQVVNETSNSKNQSEIILNRSERSIMGSPSSYIPITRLISDPTTKIDMPKTLDNVGSVVRHTFENSRAPMYHVRNLLGNTKNTLMSAAKVPPNNICIPSLYEVSRLPGTKKEEENVSENNENVLSANNKVGESDDDHSETMDAFLKIGKILREGVESSKNVALHVNDVATDARNVIYTAKHAAPRLIIPGQIPINSLTSSPNANLQGRKAVLITPRFFDVQENIVGTEEHNNEDTFVGIGNILDAVGLTKPNTAGVELEQIVLEPSTLDVMKQWTKPKELRSSSAVKTWMKTNLQKEGPKEVTPYTTSSLTQANLRSVYDQMHRDMKQVLQQQYEQRKRKRTEKVKKAKSSSQYAARKKDKYRKKKPLRKTVVPIEEPVQKLGATLKENKEVNYDEIISENMNVTLPPEILKLFSENAPQNMKINSQNDNNETFHRDKHDIDMNRHMSQVSRDTVENEKESEKSVRLYLIPELMKPLKDQYSEDVPHTFMHENGDKEYSESSSISPSTIEETKSHPITQLNLNSPRNAPSLLSNIRTVGDPNSNAMKDNSSPKDYSDKDRKKNPIKKTLVPIEEPFPKLSVQEVNYDEIISENTNVTLSPEMLQLISENAPQNMKINSRNDNDEGIRRDKHDDMSRPMSQVSRDTVGNGTRSEETVRLHLIPELMEPFMGQPSEDVIHTFMRENGDEDYLESSSISPNTIRETKSHPITPLNLNISNPRNAAILLMNTTSSSSKIPTVGEPKSNAMKDDGLSPEYNSGSLNENEAVGFLNPITEQLNPEDDKQISPSITNQLFESKTNLSEITKKQQLNDHEKNNDDFYNSTSRTSMKIIDIYKNPFMGYIGHDKIADFLNQYNNDLESENEPNDIPQDIPDPVKGLVFSNEDNYNLVI